jgi:PAS domain S-box-containing protein
MGESVIFRTMAENAADIVCLHHPDGRYIYVSPSCKRILGYDPGDLIGTDPYKLVHPEDLAGLQQGSHPKVLEGQDAVVTYRIRKSSGDYVWFESTNRPIVDGKGRVRQVVSISREITARRKTEDEQAKEYAAESTPIGIVLADLEGKLLYVNHAFLSMRGIEDKRDVLGKKIVDLSSNKDIVAEWLKAVKERGIWSRDAVARRRDGSSFNEHIVANIVTNASGQPCYMMASFIDTTERTRMEESLLDSEEKFKTLAELSPNFIYIMKRDRLIYVNRRCEEIAGRTREEICAPQFDFMSFIAPESRDTIKGVIQAHSKGSEIAPAEFVMMASDGSRIDAVLQTSLITYGGERAALGTVTDITRLKEAERLSQQSEAQYRELVENANSFILRYDSNGKITFFNKYAQSFFGYSEREAIGENVMMLVPARESSGRSLKTLASDILRHPDVFTEFENQNVLKDGTLVWVSWRNKAIKDSNGNIIAIQAIGQDITRLKEAEEELRSREERFRLLIENLRSGVALIDAQGRFITYNPAFLKMFGLSTESDILNVNSQDWAAWEVYAEDGKTLLPVDEHPVRKAALTHKPVRERLVGVRLPSGGELIWMLVNAEPLFKPDGSIKYLLATYHDITELKKAEQLKDDLIGMVSHELRTPLTVIIGALSTAMDKRASKEDKEELVLDAISSAESLASILDNMLELSRYQAGRLKLEKKPVRIVDITEKAILRVRRKYDTHDILLNIPAEIPDIDADAVRIEQVLYNLIENAVKYSPENTEIHI